MALHIPRVSVGLPVYNGERHLAQAIESVLAQTFTDFELILCDNASTDRTEEICRDYAAGDSRIHYHRNAENIGAPRNYDATFHHSRGPYFKWMSSHDFCGSEFLAKCVSVLDRQRDVVVVCPLTRLIYESCTVNEQGGMDLMEEDACVRFKTFLRRIQLNNVFNGVIRANALRRTAMHKLFLGSDVVLFAELTLHGKFAVVPELLFNRRMDSSSASRFLSETQLKQMFEPRRTKPLIFQHWKEHLGYFAAVRRARPNWGRRVCLYRFLLRRVVRDRDNLMVDLWQAGRQTFGSKADYLC